MVDKIKVSEVLNNTQVITNPFPHMIIDDFLSEDAFKELANVVSNTHSGVKESASVDNQIIIDTRDTIEFPEFWNNWFDVFDSSEVKNILKQKYNIKEDFDNMRCDIHKCEPGFKLGRHNDVKKGHNRLLSLQIYISENDSDNGVVLNDTKHIENKPNRAWTFLCSPDSWHSVPNVTKTRHSVLMKYISLK